jgi:hypothetical protein
MGNGRQIASSVEIRDEDYEVAIDEALQDLQDVVARDLARVCICSY